MSEAADETTGGKPARTREPALIEVLIVLIVLGIMAAVFVHEIVRRHPGDRVVAVERAYGEILTASPARAKELIAAFPELVNPRRGDSFAALHYAAKKGRKDAAEVLLANGADVNVRDLSDWTPLHFAASRGHKDVAQVLLANGADVNAKDVLGRTPLHLAAPAWRGGKHVAELLLAKGADVNAKDEDG